MNLYSDINNAGELWLKDFQSNIKPAYNLLSSIFIKYKNNQNFYQDLNSNNILKFDTFYDSLFIQTKSGYIFEKITTKDNGIFPYSQFSTFTSSTSTNNIDYWLDEKSKKVYFSGFNDLLDFNTHKIIFSIFLKEFNLNDGKINDLFSRTIILPLCSAPTWTNSNGIKEDPKLTYNPDTDLFNISFLIKDINLNIGLISVNFDTQKIDAINTFIPFVGSVDIPNITIN
jgi:hypothetical protein